MNADLIIAMVLICLGTFLVCYGIGRNMEKRSRKAEQDIKEREDISLQAYFDEQIELYAKDAGRIKFAYLVSDKEFKKFDLALVPVRMAYLEPAPIYRIVHEATAKFSDATINKQIQKIADHEFERLKMKYKWDIETDPSKTPNSSAR